VSHPIGQSKAVFFRALGYDDDNADQLADALVNIARTATVSDTIKTSFGIKYSVPGQIATPSGRVVAVLTIWIIEIGTEVPRFVTAYPFAGED
jgi:hypothetical protein